MDEINQVKDQLIRKCRRILVEANMAGETVTDESSQSRFKLTRQSLEDIINSVAAKPGGTVVQVPTLSRKQYIDLKTAKLKSNEDQLRSVTPDKESLSTLKNQMMHTVYQRTTDDP